MKEVVFNKMNLGHPNPFGIFWIGMAVKCDS